MRVAVAASPAVAIPSIQALRASKHELAFIISQPDRSAGRGRELKPTEVSQFSIENSIELFRPVEVDEIAALAEQVDCVITIGYGVLLPERVLTIPRYGFLNMHFSLLPRWRGAAPVQRAIEAQDAISGVTIFKLDSGMDTGPIYTVHRYALDADITSDELLHELAEEGVGALLETLDAIESGVKPIAQSNEGVTRARKLSKEEGRVDWSQAAEVISAKIRAFTSNPGAWTIFRGSALKIATPSLTTIALAPGEVSVLDKRVLIGTGTSALEIGEITPQGRNRMSAAAWANGARISPGERCE